MPLIIVRANPPDVIERVIESAMALLRKSKIYPNGCAAHHDQGGEIYGEIVVEPSDLALAIKLLTAGGIRISE